MRYHLICDNRDTLVGMRLAGIDGEQVSTESEVRAAIEAVLAQSGIGILLITEKCAAMCPALIGDIKLNLSAPLLVEIPDRGGTGRSPDSITRYIRESIGVKL